MGIPVYLESSETPSAVDTSKMTAEELYNYPTRIDVICDAMKGISELVGRKGNMDEYIAWAQGYNKLVKDRIATLPRDQLVSVFYEWNAYPYRTYVDMSVYQGGGFNIAEQAYREYTSTLNPEFVVEQNPSVIIELISSDNHNVNDFIATKTAVINRSATQGVDAVRNGRVYVCDFAARNGLRAVIGYVYFATWIQPELFSDVNPGTVSQELTQKFGISVSGTYCY
jgi:ABC-type Fe3+-hydroxamate transport system substrate-binding protein